MPVEFKVVGAQPYDCTDIGGGKGVSWPYMEAKAPGIQRLQVALYDTRPATVAKACEHLMAEVEKRQQRRQFQP